MKTIIFTCIFLIIISLSSMAQELVIDYPQFTSALDTVYVDFKVMDHGKKVNPGVIDLDNISLQRTGDNGTEDVTSLVEVRDIRNYDPDYTSGNYAIIVLADRSVTAEQLQAERQAITDLYQAFPQARFFITAMDKGRTPTTEIQDVYQLMSWYDSCFMQPFGEEKFIYKALASVLQEVTESEAHDFYPETPINNTIKDYAKKKIFVMTNGVYTKADGSYIGGEDFFRIKMALIQELNQKKEAQVNFVYFGEGVNEDGFHHEVQYVFKEGDKFITNFNAQQLKEQMVVNLDPEANDYRLVIVNKFYKLYDGQKLTLHAYFEKDDVDAYGSRTFTLGNLIDPIPVMASKARKLTVLSMCLVIGLVVIGLLYLFFRYIYPKWRFRAFKKRYVKRFERPNTLPAKAKDYVAQRCYYCKDPFVPGEEIVTRCEHTMHYDCWRENGHQCPEYGRECDNGPFFYNEDHPSDKRNIPHFLRWLIVGCLCGMAGWLVFRLTSGNHFLYDFIRGTMALSKKVGIDVTGNTITDKVHDLLSFGTIIGFFIILGASWLLEHRKKTAKRIMSIVGRALLGALGGLVAFFIGSLVTIGTAKDYNSFFVDIIPWLLMGGVLGFVIAYRKEVSMRKAVLFGFLFAMIGFTVLYFFSYENSNFEFKNVGLITSTLGLLGTMTLGGGLYAGIATHDHHSKIYFLHIDGNLKSRDVAVYKWMSRDGGHRMVTIGRSDRCYIDMDWDNTEGIDGPQVEVFIENDSPFYRMINTNQVCRLSHGTSFRIGTTTFTFIEKDRS